MFVCKKFLVITNENKGIFGSKKCDAEKAIIQLNLEAAVELNIGLVSPRERDHQG
jgi:hypothetical protein